MGHFYDAREGSVVYFDSNSGDTHLLTDFAAFVIQQFPTEPIATDDLLVRLTPHVESDNLAELRESVSSVLQELLALDIVQTV